MSLDLQQLMAQATRLTQGGQLAEATTLLRSLMGDAMGGANGGAMAGGFGAAAQPASDVIDVVAHRVDDGAKQPVERSGGFTAHSFANDADRRDYKLFVPSGKPAGPMPLVVMLHGCSQDPDDFAAGTRMNALAQAQGFAVLYPAQSRQANPQGCWNWFKHTHQMRGRGEPALIAGMVQQVMANQAIDPKRVYVAGLSAGGAMAAILGETYPDLFAAVGVHSGLAAGAADDLSSALSSMQSGAATERTGRGSGRPTIVFHGESDSTVNVGNARDVLAASVGAAAAKRGEASTLEGKRGVQREVFRTAKGAVVAELWLVRGGPHAWSGGSGTGSYTDPAGPDASQEMLRFFRGQSLP